MLRGADAGRTERDLVWIGLQISDQIRHGARLDLVGVDDQHIGHDANLHDRLQILVGLIDELRWQKVIESANIKLD